MYPRFAALKKPLVKLTQWDVLEVDGVLQKRSGDTKLSSDDASSDRQSSDNVIGGSKHEATDHSLSCLYQVLGLKAPEFLDDAEVMEDYRKKCPREGLAHPPPPAAASLEPAKEEEEEEEEEASDKKLCEICCDREETAVLLCGHGACAECWETYTHLHRTDEELTCMQCPSVIDSISRSYFSPSSWPVTVRRLALEYVDPSYSACVGCSRYFKSASPIVQCSGCQKLTCGLCEKACHWPLPCGDAMRYVEIIRSANRSISQKLTMRHNTGGSASLVGVRACPHCRTLMEKNGGCNQMTCRCKQTFDWGEQQETVISVSDLQDVPKKDLKGFKLEEIEKAFLKIEDVRRKLLALRRTRRRVENQTADSRVESHRGKKNQRDFSKLAEELEITLPLLTYLFVVPPREGQHHELKHFLKDTLELVHFRLQGALEYPTALEHPPALEHQQGTQNLRDAMKAVYTRLTNKLPPLVYVGVNSETTRTESMLRREASDRNRGRNARNNNNTRNQESSARAWGGKMGTDINSPTYNNDIAPRHMKEKEEEEQKEDPEWFGDSLAALLEEGVEFDAAWNALAECKGNLESAKARLHW